jgi:hypothetical protein
VHGGAAGDVRGSLAASGASLEAAGARGSQPPTRGRAGWWRRAARGGAPGRASSLSCFVSAFLLLNALLCENLGCI